MTDREPSDREQRGLPPGNSGQMTGKETSSGAKYSRYYLVVRTTGRRARHWTPRTPEHKDFAEHRAWRRRAVHALASIAT
jgi:hypothetical protein